MCNLVPLSLSGIAETWFVNLRRRSIRSWERLQDVFVVNFQRNYMQPLISSKLLILHQKTGESMLDFFKRFTRVRSQIGEAPDSAVIHAFHQALLQGELNRALSHNPPRTAEDLFHVVEEYTRGEDSNRTKSPEKSVAEKVR